jgi:Putative DNA-binding domain
MSHEREALRQRALLRGLWREAAREELSGWLGTPFDDGLAVYRSNAGAIAERALAATYPTLAALVGEASFAALARDVWQHHPPTRGDLGEWGGELPEFIAASTQLADEPYLADSARLDWLVHRASRAADAPAAPPDLTLLASTAPERLHLRLVPGTAVLESRHPVVAIWQAHQQAHQPGAGESESEHAERFAAVRAAFAAGQADSAWVRREGYAVRVERIDAPAAAFVGALLAGHSLASALDLSGPAFAFDQWLVHAITQRALAAIEPLPPTTSP